MSYASSSVSQHIEPRMRQLVDWSAALWAGLIAGIVFLILNLIIIPIGWDTNIWLVVRLFASIVMGERALPPPADFDPVILVVALVTHLALSIIFALLLAYIIHRWGLIVGIIGGAIFGIAIFCINVYGLTYFYYWFSLMRSWPFLLAHIIFGALAGGIYEALEVEEFVVDHS